MAVNAPESSGCTLGVGGVYSHITKATCANYYITSHLIGPHDFAINMAYLSNKIKLSLGEQGDIKINALFSMGLNVLGR